MESPMRFCKKCGAITEKFVCGLCRAKRRVLEGRKHYLLFGRKNRKKEKRRKRIIPREKMLAKRMLRSAIYYGYMERPDKCEMCGQENKVFGHHYSYEISRWLDVIWLCSMCHGFVHRKY